MEIKILQLHKEGVQVFEKIEDKVAFNTVNNTVAISDGATQGFASGIWAGILTDEFVARPTFNPNQFGAFLLKQCSHKFAAYIDNMPVTADKNMARLLDTKKKEGGYATFIGLQIIDNHTCKVICTGDSNLFHLSGSQINALPSNTLEGLNNASGFINSEHIRNDKFDAGVLVNYNFPIVAGDEIYLATDAVSRYLFKNISEIKDIGNIDHFEQLLSFAESRWKKGSLEKDDLTLVKISFKQPATTVQAQIKPPADFIFEVETPQMSSYQPKEAIAVPINAGNGDSDEVYSYKRQIALLQDQVGKQAASLNQATNDNLYFRKLNSDGQKRFVASALVNVLLFVLMSVAVYWGVTENRKNKSLQEDKPFNSSKSKQEQAQIAKPNQAGGAGSTVAGGSKAGAKKDSLSDTSKVRQVEQHPQQRVATLGPAQSAGQNDPAQPGGPHRQPHPERKHGQQQPGEKPENPVTKPGPTPPVVTTPAVTPTGGNPPAVTPPAGTPAAAAPTAGTAAGAAPAGDQPPKSEEPNKKPPLLK